MSKVRSNAGKAARSAGRPAAGGVRSMFRDPVVMWMAYAAIGLVILFLATVMGALLTGVSGKAESPQTASERDLVLAAAAVQTGGETGAQWAPYINTLVANGNLQKARIALDTARASVHSTTTAPELELAEARLELAQSRYPQAIKSAEKAVKTFETRHRARIAAGGDTARRAKEMGIEADYYNGWLVKGYACVGMKKWKDAVAAFDVYMKGNPTASDILVDRGNAKASMNDKAGAEKDFREALRFVPYDKDAQAGLKKIGAAR